MDGLVSFFFLTSQIQNVFFQSPNLNLLMIDQHSKMYTHLVCGSKVQCGNTYQDEKLIEISQECRIFGSLNLKFIR